jgi:hypothetical protein
MKDKSMKVFQTLAFAALLSAGTAFAAAAPTATPAPTAKPAALHTKHASAAHCEKEARARKLSGDAEKNFVKECKEGKTAG